MSTEKKMPSFEQEPGFFRCLCGNRPYREKRDYIEGKLTEVDKLSESKPKDHEVMWNAINKRIPYSIFFSIILILLAALGVLFSATYSQGSKTLERVNAINVSMSAFSKSVENNEKNIMQNKAEIDQLRTNKTISDKWGTK